jgi:predicted metal-dependent hydrolase
VLNYYTINYKGQDIVLQIVRSKRKSISIEFRLIEGIKVKIPVNLKDKVLLEFMHTHEEAIIKKYEEVLKQKDDLQMESLDKIYKNGRKIPYLAEEVTIIITSELEMTPTKKYIDLTKTAYVYFIEEVTGKYLRIETMVDDPFFIRTCVVNRYKDKAKELFKDKVEKYALEMKVNYKNITVKEQKTKWGSCSSKGNLNFNWKLIMMPEPVIDYVVVHELSHLKFMNHSKDFWREVEKILPEYKLQKNWLSQNGMKYQMY